MFALRPEFPAQRAAVEARRAGLPLQREEVRHVVHGPVIMR